MSHVSPSCYSASEVFQSTVEPNVQCQSVPKESQYNNVVSCSRSLLCHNLLMTARVQVKDSAGNLVYCRKYLDCGSLMHMISRSLVASLYLLNFSTNVKVVGANSQRSTLTEMVTIEIGSVILTMLRNLSALLVIHDVAANPEFNIPGDIALLIGMQLFFKLLS